MNIFAKLKEVHSFPKVKYYSIFFQGEVYTEYGKFVSNHSSSTIIEKEYNDLKAWLKIRLGQRDGALADYFRPERDAQALPPQQGYLSIVYKKKLRLYCLRLSDHVVILFNGGIKTEKYAQDCPNVKDHFENANQLSIAINKALEQGSLRLNDDKTELIIEPGFKLEI